MKIDCRMKKIILIVIAAVLIAAGGFLFFSLNQKSRNEMHLRMTEISEETLKEVIGHTPRQVYAGAIFGLIVGLLVEVIWMTH